jgi:SPX domain protein involved in polyphosphate accumulation
VHTFCTLKGGELKRRIDAAEKIADAISKAPHPSMIDTLEHERDEVDGSEGSEDGDGDSARARGRLENLDKEIRSITAEVKELAGFAALNFTGIKKV